MGLVFKVRGTHTNPPCPRVAYGRISLIMSSNYASARLRSLIDLPVPNWSSVNVRLDRNQGGYSHAQKTVHA